MAEIKLNKQHPLYQEDLKRILDIPQIEMIKGKSFLITGATGLIGTCLIDALMFYNSQEADIQIYAVGWLNGWHIGGAALNDTSVA